MRTNDESIDTESPRIRVDVTDPHFRTTSATGYYLYSGQRKTFDYPFDFFADDPVAGTYTIEVRIDFDRVASGSITVN